MFDDAEKHVSDSEVQDATQDAEKMADKETGNKFDSQVQDAGTWPTKRWTSRAASSSSSSRGKIRAQLNMHGSSGEPG